MTKIKLLFLTPIWGRKEVVRMHMDNMDRIAKANAENFEITQLYVVSEDWASNLCFEHGYQYFWHYNQPLGRKLNNGLKSVLSENFDFLVTNGSDDFCEPEILEEYLPYFSQYPAFGVNTVYAVEENTGRQKMQNIGYPFGAMRCVKWSLIRQMNGNFWNDNDCRGLDYYSMVNLKEKTGVDIQVVYTETKIWDVKGTFNINTFSKFGGGVIESLELPLELKYLQKQ